MGQYGSAGLKTCTYCQFERPVTEFHKYKRLKDGLQSRCKSCAYIAHHQWRLDNPERDKAANKAWKEANWQRCLELDRLRDYGLQPHDFYTMYADQHESCTICRSPLTIRTAHVDHDHATLRVRGLLCNTCNIGLANFRDTPAFLLEAARYLDGGLPS